MIILASLLGRLYMIVNFSLFTIFYENIEFSMDIESVSEQVLHHASHNRALLLHWAVIAAHVQDTA